MYRTVIATLSLVSCIACTVKTGDIAGRTSTSNASPSEASPGDGSADVADAPAPTLDAGTVTVRHVDAGDAGNSAQLPASPTNDAGGVATITNAARPDGGTDATDAGTEAVVPSIRNFCTSTSWVAFATTFADPAGETIVPPGTYTVRYMSGAIMHDGHQGYEITPHYTYNGIQVGYHLVSDQHDEWLSTFGLVGDLASVSDVEETNSGHTWTIWHPGGPIRTIFRDNSYSDNKGPGIRLCITVAQ